MTRGQANLAALVTALFALAAVTVLGLSVADGALAAEDRNPGERHAAMALSERLVAADSPLTNRSNVLDGSAVDALTVDDLARRYPLLDGRDVRITLDGETIASDGSAAGGASIRRIVLVERTQRETVEPEFSGGNTVTLPRRTPRIRISLTPPDDAEVTAVRANERTVLADADGLSGTYDVSLPRRETVRLAFVANGSLSRGDATVTLFPRRTSKAGLEVTVDG